MTSKKTSSDLPATFTSDQFVTTSEAVTITGRDRKTINDWCKTGRYRGAYQDVTGRQGWHIPIRALVDAGHLDPKHVVEVESMLETARESRKVKELRDRIAELETTVQVHIALADERLSMIETLRAIVLGTQAEATR